MNLLRNYLVCSISFIVIISCNPEPYTQQKTGTPLRISDSYKPPVFTNDNHVEMIKNMAPEIQSLIEEYAKERNIPGIAWGIVVDDELVVGSATGLKYRFHPRSALVEPYHLITK